LLVLVGDFQWSPVAESGVDRLTIVEHFDVLGNGRAGPRPGGEDGAVDERVLQGGDARRGHRVVPAHAAASPRTADAVPLPVAPELGGGVLAAALAMNYRTAGQIDLPRGPGDRVAGRVRAQVLGHRPADDRLAVGSRSRWPAAASLPRCGRR